MIQTARDKPFWKRIVVYFADHPKMLLGCLVVLSIVVCFWNYLTGAKYLAFYDIGSDTVLGYQPDWLAAADDIKEGISSWSFNSGLGNSTFSYYTWIFDPFSCITILSYIIGSFHAMQVTIAWLQGIKFLLCALICYDFLSEFHISSHAKIITSYIYAFCGFLVLWGQHYHFATRFVFASLFFLTLERAINEDTFSKKHIQLALSAAWLAALTYYFSYHTFITAAFYVLIRIFTKYSIKDKKWFYSGIKIVVCMVIGIMLSSVSFIPAAYGVSTVSNRISVHNNMLSFFRIQDIKHIQTILCRYLSNNLQGIKDYKGYWNYYEAEQFFFSSFLISFSIIFVSAGWRKGKRAFIGRLLLILLLFLAPFIQITSVIYNAFVNITGRYTFVLMPIYAIIVAKALEAILERQVPSVAYLLSAIVYGIIIYYCARNAAGFNLSLGTAIVAEVIAFLVLSVLLSISAAHCKTLQICIALVVFLNVFTDTWLTTNHRTTLTDKYSKSDIVEMTQKVKLIDGYLKAEDNEFFRIEKTYSDYSWFNDARVENYYGISNYNSAMNANVVQFFAKCWSKINDPPISGAYVQFERDPYNTSMAGLLGVKYIISDSARFSCPGYSLLCSINGRYIYKNVDYHGFARFYTSIISPSDFLSYSEEDRQSILQDYLVMDTGVAVPPAEAEIKIERPVSENHIQGFVNSTGPGYIYLPIPYQNGWKAIVNGMALDIIKADFGFMAIPVEAGNSEFALDYSTPYLKEGIIISLIGALILIGTACFCKYKRNMVHKGLNK